MNSQNRSVGFLANIIYDFPQPGIRRHFFDRIITMSKILEEHGVELIVYSPIAVDPDTGNIEGYLIKSNKFVKKITKIPKINGDWMVHDPKLHDIMIKVWGDSYPAFRKWHQNHQIKYFVPNDCANFFRDKKTVQEHVAKISTLKQPKVALFDGSLNQLEDFLNFSSKIFLKPQHGSKSNNIVAVWRSNSTVHVNLYPNDYNVTGQIDKNNCATIKDAWNIIRKFIIGKTYIIQEAIDVPRFNDSPISLRIAMVNDGSNWHVSHETYIGEPGSDTAYSLAEIASYNSIEILNKLFSFEQAEKIMSTAIEHAKLLTNYFDNMFPDMLPELAYDFVLNKKGDIYFLEANTKPAIPYPGPYLKSKMFKILPEEKQVYDEYIIPYATRLAHFFLKKLDL